MRTGLELELSYDLDVPDDLNDFEGLAIPDILIGREEFEVLDDLEDLDFLGTLDIMTGFDELDVSDELDLQGFFSTGGSGGSSIICILYLPSLNCFDVLQLTLRSSIVKGSRNANKPRKTFSIASGVINLVVWSA